jgi:hypothetical protein
MAMAREVVEYLDGERSRQGGGKGGAEREICVALLSGLWEYFYRQARDGRVSVDLPSIVVYSFVFVVAKS